MRWPRLVPPGLCNVPVKVYRVTGTGEDGAPLRELIFDGKCNFDEKLRQTLTADKRLIRLEGTALFDGDLCPGQELTGEAELGARTYQIYRAGRCRNPDGTVNYTRLELM